MDILDPTFIGELKKNKQTSICIISDAQQRKVRTADACTDTDDSRMHR